jgi:hypothetical protein
MSFKSDPNEFGAYPERGYPGEKAKYQNSGAKNSIVMTKNAMIQGNPASEVREFIVP